MSKYLALSFIIVAFLLGTGYGYWLSPQYENMSAKAEDMGLGEADEYVDLRYLDGMIAHHKAAIYLAEQAKEGSKRTEIVELSKTIIANDERDIAKLYRYKNSWYKDKREIKDFTKVNLGEYDKTFDLRFLNAMTVHHEDAIMVAKEVRTKSTRAKVLNIADRTITNLEKGIDGLEEWRDEWYGTKMLTNN